MMTESVAIQRSPDCDAACGDDQMVLKQMAAVRELMTAAATSIFERNPGSLLNLSRELLQRATAVQFALAALSQGTWLAAAQEDRRQLLLQLGRARALLAAGLRRWRRDVMLRRNLLRLQDESSLFNDAFSQRWY